MTTWKIWWKINQLIGIGVNFNTGASLIKKSLRQTFASVWSTSICQQLVNDKAFGWLRIKGINQAHGKKSPHWEWDSLMGSNVLNSMWGGGADPPFRNVTLVRGGEGAAGRHCAKLTSPYAPRGARLLYYSNNYVVVNTENWVPWLFAINNDLSNSIYPPRWKSHQFNEHCQIHHTSMNCTNTLRQNNPPDKANLTWRSQTYE